MPTTGVVSMHREEDPFDKLAREVREQVRRAPTQIAQEAIARTTKQELPDALVLCVMKVKCDCCGSEWESPSHHLMLRTGRQHIHTSKSMFLFKNLPREMIVKEDHAPSCARCFGVVTKVTHFS